MFKNLSANALCLLVAVWIALTGNLAFWALFFRVEHNTLRDWMFAVGLVVSLIGLNLFLLRILSPGRALRGVLSLLLLITAIASWFMDTYGVGIDADMLRNVVQTNVAEAHDFFGWSLLWRVAWQAGLPMFLVWRVKLPATSCWRSARQYLLGAVLGLLLLFGAALPQYVSYASFFRNQQLAEHLLAPMNVIRAGAKLMRKKLAAKQPYVVVGADAWRTHVPGAKPLLTVMVVGETARADHFSLGGYGRETNPLLKQRNVLFFNNVYSCGTATAISVPCMFSGMTRQEFDPSEAERRDTVFDILQRAGLTVHWIDNQSGCKGVCARIPTEEAAPYHRASCSNGECKDDALLYALDSNLSGLAGDSVLALHMMGSHGPTYNQRVPPDQMVFKPACLTERIETCSRQQVVNIYDNTIRYTDFILAGLIDRLQKREKDFDIVLLYVSDHGESLGEDGLYLHGQPYAVAPEVQKHVPMILWFSAGAPTHLGIDLQCLRGQVAEPLSHDYVSHTLLGLNDVHTRAYRAQLDMLQRCRSLYAIARRKAGQALPVS